MSHYRESQDMSYAIRARLIPKNWGDLPEADRLSLIVAAASTSKQAFGHRHRS